MAAVDLRSPERVRVRLAGSSSSRRMGAAAIAVDAAVRVLLVGLGAGLVLIAGARGSVESVTVLGILALGATLVEWDR